MIKNTPEQSHSTIKRVLRQTFSNRLSYYNEEQIDAGCSDRASEICKAAESLGIVLGDVSELTKQRDELLAALERLSFAAMCRDSTMGDPCRLIEVRAELAAANKQASVTIASVTEK